MNLDDVRGLLRLQVPELDGHRRRLAACLTVGDLRRLARRRLPRSVFDYVDGGADEEITLRGNVAAFRRWRFRPSVLVDVADTDLRTSILGGPAEAPLGFAPTGYTRMVSPIGEPAVAAAAARVGIPYVLSTMATTSLEELARGPGRGADRWFQLYVWKDRELTRRMVERAAACGYRVLEVTVDTPVSGYRTRDVRNGFTIPPSVTFGALLDIGLRPGYWRRMLAAPALRFANVGGGSGGSIADIGGQFDPSVTWSELARIREMWPGKLVLKGPVGPRDAVRAVELGADGVHLSNHGGRQLDRTIAPIDLVAPVRAALGDGPAVLVDSGVRHGADIATAVALGADAAFAGRAYLWGLAAGGFDGVRKAATLLTDQLRRTMQLAGVTSIAQLRQEGPELLVREGDR